LDKNGVTKRPRLQFTDMKHEQPATFRRLRRYGTAFMQLKRLVYYLNSPAYDSQVIACLLVQFCH